MINPLQIRIGNYYLNPNGQTEMAAEVSQQSLTPFRSQPGWSIEKCKPIPITKYWLELFSFDKNYNGLNAYRYELYLEHDRWLVYWKVNDSFLLRGDNDYGVFIYDIKYVHQLQNLYNALTGKELAKKEELKEDTTHISPKFSDITDGEIEKYVLAKYYDNSSYPFVQGVIEEMKILRDKMLAREKL